MGRRFLSLQHLCVIAVLPLLFSVSPSLAALQWHRLKNAEALCNDFSRAGYFVDRNDASSEWIIFLESGGLCYSPDTCNQRFFNSSVRRNRQYSTGGKQSGVFPNFNTTAAWRHVNSSNASSYINPYMTSVETFSNESYFSNGLEVEGTDLFDRNCSVNPFCNFSMVLVPYCSSDVWLGNDTRSMYKFNADDSLQDQFLHKFFSPDRNTLQFTFRGRVIFQSVIQELVGNLSNATDVILAGSSAGGIGAVNNARWLKEQLPSSTNLSIISDSSWFVNFKDIIYQGFNGSLNNGGKRGSQENASSLLDLISDIPQCLDTSRGPPCCLSLFCMLQEERYFPKGEIPTIALSSLYDVFLLAYAINSTLPIGAVTKNQEKGTQSKPSIGLQFLTTTAEYGGVMNSTLRSTSSFIPNRGLSYIATHCFQHIYLVTSTLWNESGLLGSESNIELERNLGMLRTSFE